MLRPTRKLFVCAMVMAVAPLALAGTSSDGKKGAPEERPAGNPLVRAVREGTLDGEVGLQFRSEFHDDNSFTIGGESEDRAHGGWGYLDVSWLSAPVHDTQLGLGGLAIAQGWKGDGFAGDDDIFEDGQTWSDPARWTQAYLKHTIDEGTYVIAGRADDDLFGEPATGDGDFYRGIGFTISTLPRVRLRAHAVNEWLNNASPSWDFNGMDEDWAHMREGSLEVGEDADRATSSRFGDFAYTAMAEIQVVREILTVTPYVQHHSNVATCYGTSFRAEKAVSEAWSVGLNGAWATHRERTPDDLWPSDEDVNQSLVHLYGKHGGFTVGVGHYRVSNDVPLFNGKPGSDQFERDFKDIFVMDEMDPLEEDIGKYGEQQGSRTFYADTGYSWGRYSLDVIYGIVDDALVEVPTGGGGARGEHAGEGSELNVTLSADITKKLSAELMYGRIEDDFMPDGDSGFHMVAGAVSYSF